MRKSSLSYIASPILYTLLCLFGLVACEEEYSQEPPFPQVQDTIFLDLENWFYFNPNPIVEKEIAYFPFAYRIFDARFEGFLVNQEQAIYTVDREKNLGAKQLFLDNLSQPGDTISHFERFQYSLLIEREPDQGEDLFYILRRSRLGIERFRERAIWLVSPSKGIVGAANFDIGTSDGQVEMDIIGRSEPFRNPELIKTLKYYDYDATWLVDPDRRVIYEFDKFKGLLTSRDYQKREDLYQYAFNPVSTKHLVNFQLKQDNQSRTILLEAGDSCFYFTESLNLQRSGLCGQ
ncbi:MAG: hypothetical protein AAF927_26010 [Bacteroidota bacterium]